MLRVVQLMDVQVDYNGALHSDLKDRIASFLRQEQRERRLAAQRATEATRAQYRFNGGRSRRAVAPPRAGRRTTQGNLQSYMQWRSTAGGVEFDRGYIERRAPYWIIQEIGTGKSATIRRGGEANPRGRPGKGAAYRVSVKSQRGRVLPRHLAWGNQGRFSPAGSTDQLFLRNKLTGAAAFHPGQRAVISREIRGVHFVQRGGVTGYRQYHRQMGQVFKNTLVKKYKP